MTRSFIVTIEGVDAGQEDLYAHEIYEALSPLMQVREVKPFQSRIDLTPVEPVGTNVSQDS